MSALRDMPTHPPPKPKIAAWMRIAISALAGIAVGTAIAAATDWDLLPLLSWDAACLVLLTWVWRNIWRMDAEQTGSHSAMEDASRAMSDLLVLGAAVVSLVAVGVVLGRASTSNGSTKGLLAALGVASIVLSWAVVHTIFTLQYARLYYAVNAGGISFNQDDPPRYSDFAYLAFTIGMTFQVSDTDIQTNEIRRAALRQALLSYVFGTGIVATTINLIANL